MSTNEIFNQMLSGYDITTEQQKRNAIFEVNQEELDKETFLQKLNERLATADMNQVKADVLPFVRNPKELDIWSNDYFMQLAKMIRFE